MNPYTLIVHSRRLINLLTCKLYRYTLFDRYFNPIIYTDFKEELKINMDLRGIYKIKNYEVYREDLEFRDAKIVFE